MDQKLHNCLVHISLGFFVTLPLGPSKVDVYNAIIKQPESYRLLVPCALVLLFFSWENFATALHTIFLLD